MVLTQNKYEEKLEKLVNGYNRSEDRCEKFDKESQGKNYSLSRGLFYFEIILSRNYLARIRVLQRKSFLTGLKNKRIDLDHQSRYYIVDHSK